MADKSIANNCSNPNKPKGVTRSGKGYQVQREDSKGDTKKVEFPKEVILTDALNKSLKLTAQHSIDLDKAEVSHRGSRSLSCGFHNGVSLEDTELNLSEINPVEGIDSKVFQSQHTPTSTPRTSLRTNTSTPRSFKFGEMSTVTEEVMETRRKVSAEELGGILENLDLGGANGGSRDRDENVRIESSPERNNDDVNKEEEQQGGGQDSDTEPDQRLSEESDSEPE